MVSNLTQECQCQRAYGTKQRTNWVGAGTLYFVNWVVDMPCALFLTLREKEFYPTMKPISWQHQEGNWQRELEWEWEQGRKSRGESQWEGKVGEKGQVPLVRSFTLLTSLRRFSTWCCFLRGLDLVLLKKIEFLYVSYVPSTFQSISHTLCIEF